MSIKYQLLAAVEVAGRRFFDRIPTLRKKISRSVRKAPENPMPVELPDLAALLRALGVEHGDVLMVHSAWDGLRQLTVKPSQVIAMLKGLLGEQGTLVMPAGPIMQFQNGIQVFDVQKSPSSLGLLSESFRRMPEVLRSPVPMGSVCASGPLAEEFTKDYYEESGGTPYGYGSPYWAMREHHGKVLVLGIDFIRVLSISHCAFDILGDDNPIKGYHIEIPFIVINGDKQERVTVRRPDFKWASYLATGVFKNMIMQTGFCKRAELGGIKIALIDAEKFLGWHLQIAKQLGWPYWGFPRTRKNEIQCLPPKI